jgi:hypothetical protein
MIQVCGEYIYVVRVKWRNYVIFYNIYREKIYVTIKFAVRMEKMVLLSFLDVMVTKIQMAQTYGIEEIHPYGHLSSCKVTPSATTKACSCYS